VGAYSTCCIANNAICHVLAGYPDRFAVGALHATKEKALMAFN
jgi:hypothetical protein